MKPVASFSHSPQFGFIAKPGSVEEAEVKALLKTHFKVEPEMIDICRIQPEQKPCFWGGLRAKWDMARDMQKIRAKQEQILSDNTRHKVLTAVVLLKGLREPEAVIKHVLQVSEKMNGLLAFNLKLLDSCRDLLVYSRKHLAIKDDF